MFFLLTLVFIILLNKTNAYIRQDTETVLLPASNPTGAKEIPLTLKVFGQLIQLNLRRNDRIVPPQFKVWKNNGKSDTEKLLQLNISDSCYYYHKDHISSAAINFCHEYGLEGLVFVEDDTLEIRPLRNEFTPCLIDDIRKQTNLSFGKSHLIKRSLQYFADSNPYYWDKFKLKRRYIRKAQQNLTIELAVFYDESAYQRIMPFVRNNKKEFRNIILAYVNQIKTEFKHPRLNAFIDVSLIHLDMIDETYMNKRRFWEIDDIHTQLRLFCEYTNSINFPNDEDPDHWDISLFLTGESLYTYSLRKPPYKLYLYRKSFNVIGEAYFDGACKRYYSCGIIEFQEIKPSLNPVRLINRLLGVEQYSGEPVDIFSRDDLTNYNMTWSDNSLKEIENLWKRKTCLRDRSYALNLDDILDDNIKKSLTMRLAVFVDEAAQRKFLPILNNDEKKLHNMILAYVNQIQAMFHHPSLGISIDITLVQLKFMKQSLVIDKNTNLLDSFCKYAKSLNPSKYNDPHHWDIGLYLTGIKLYEIEDTPKRYLKEDNHVTYLKTKLTFIDKMCIPKHSCAIVEFGHVENFFSGFASYLCAVHLIGHLVGLEFDKDPFESNKYTDDNPIITVMSPYRYFRGYVTWSNHSRKQIEKLWERKPCLRYHTTSKNINNAYALDHSRYHDLPGREWTAKAQCELFLGDENANVVTLHDICQTLQCETPHNNQSYFAGPALDGTFCSLGKECRSGECVPVIEPPYIFKYCENDNWSEWKKDSCRSSCLKQSKGVIVKRRSCKRGTDRTANCIGTYYDIVLCNDSLLCKRVY
nr:PREDICTED: uncharacterized protein LOC105669606 isoform X1 [Linepithema humile]